MKKTFWAERASAIIKAELAHKQIQYDQLIFLLKEIGVEETMPSILNKMSRGTFQFAFVLQLAAAIGLKDIRLDDIPKHAVTPQTDEPI